MMKKKRAARKISTSSIVDTQMLPSTAPMSLKIPIKSNRKPRKKVLTASDIRNLSDKLRSACSITKNRSLVHSAQTGVTTAINKDDIAKNIEMIDEQGDRKRDDSIFVTKTEIKTTRVASRQPNPFSENDLKPHINQFPNIIGASKMLPENSKYKTNDEKCPKDFNEIDFDVESFKNCQEFWNYVEARNDLKMLCLYPETEKSKDPIVEVRKKKRDIPMTDEEKIILGKKEFENMKQDENTSPSAETRSQELSSYDAKALCAEMDEFDKKWPTYYKPITTSSPVFGLPIKPSSPGVTEGKATEDPTAQENM